MSQQILKCWWMTLQLSILLVCLSIVLHTQVSVSEYTCICAIGQETTGNLLAFAVILLHQHPDVLARYEVVIKKNCHNPVLGLFCCDDLRLREEIDEVLGDKKSVSADDLDNLKYTEQVMKITISHKQCMNFGIDNS